VALNLRCSLLKEHGWTVQSSGGGHEGILLFQREKVDAVVLDLNDDGAEAALITGSLKRLRPEIPVVMLIGDAGKLAPGATKQADAVVAKAEESARLHDALLRLMPAR
jgi:CheY-like chemotaxis protein